MANDTNTRRPEIRHKPTRLAYFSRAGGRCVYCGAKLHHEDFELDHVKPVSRGGSNDPHNVVVSCPSCNRAKSDRRVGEVLHDLAWQMARELAPQLAPSDCDEAEYLDGEANLAHQAYAMISGRLRRERERVLPRGAGRQLALLISRVAA